MKKSILLLAMVLLLAACAGTDNELLKVVKFDTSLHCQDCVDTMFDTLPKTDGVVDLEASLENKTVTIVFNPQETDVEKLADKIVELGYSAYVIELNDFVKKQ